MWLVGERDVFGCGSTCRGGFKALVPPLPPLSFGGCDLDVE